MALIRSHSSQASSFCLWPTLKPGSQLCSISIYCCKLTKLHLISVATANKNSCLKKKNWVHFHVSEDHLVKSHRGSSTGSQGQLNLQLSPKKDWMTPGKPLGTALFCDCCANSLSSHWPLSLITRLLHPTDQVVSQPTFANPLKTIILVLI